VFRQKERSHTRRINVKRRRVLVLLYISEDDDVVSQKEREREGREKVKKVF